MASPMMTWIGFLVLVAIAFLFTGKVVYAALNPPVHTPLRFLFRGLCLLGIAFVMAMLASDQVVDGRVDFVSRKFGHMLAVRADEPFVFWLCVGMFYAIGLFFASCGVGLLSLCWKPRR